ncbi:MAG: hypothetical protein OEY44_00005, partial [Candidatus Peregrinibacteria bacterium]|nr:hypothetical protein [Candidatus Peregrinibacteria bacterium]
LPDCTNCHQQMQIFHDPKATREKMIRKLTPDGYASLLRDAETNNVAGFGFCYGTTLKEGFNFEWGNPYNYMTNPDPEYDRDFNRFLSILNAGVEDYHFEPDTEILLWNCVAISKKARGSKNFLGLMRNMFNALPPEKRKLRIVGECMQGSVAHGLFHTVGGHDVPGFLDGDNTIITFKVGETIDLFNLPDEAFSERHKATVAKLRHG